MGIRTHWIYSALTRLFWLYIFLFARLQFLVQALYDFTPQEPGELEFKRGDVITVTDRSDQHWWTGEIGARRGLFPATYVAPYHTWKNPIVSHNFSSTCHPALFCLDGE